MLNTLEAYYIEGYQERQDYTPGSAVVSGEVVDMTGGIVGVCTSPEGIAANVKGALAVSGIFKLKKASGSGVTFSRGDKVAWDDTNNTAVPDGDANDDFTTGIAAEDAADADDGVLTLLNRTALV